MYLYLFMKYRVSASVKTPSENSRFFSSIILLRAAYANKQRMQEPSSGSYHGFGVDREWGHDYEEGG